MNTPIRSTLSGLFISRHLAPHSALFRLEPDIRINHESLLDFQPIPFEKVPTADWFFFYSQQGVKHFLSQTKIESRYRIATFGKKTAQRLLEMGIPVSFVGDGNAATTAPAFAQVATGEKVVFVRAQHSRMSLQQLLKKQIKQIDLIVYNNTPKMEYQLPYHDILVFTSPLNAQAYYTKYRCDPNQTVIAIGETTKAHLNTMGIDNVLVPVSPSEESIVDLLISELKLTLARK